MLPLARAHLLGALVALRDARTLMEKNFAAHEPRDGKTLRDIYGSIISASSLTAGALSLVTGRQPSAEEE